MSIHNPLTTLHPCLAPVTPGSKDEKAAEQQIGSSPNIDIPPVIGIQIRVEMRCQTPKNTKNKLTEKESSSLNRGVHHTIQVDEPEKTNRSKLPGFQNYSAGGCKLQT
ncbi:unnamed protein product [Cuscuta europaea]|uniref:Uncharacterized protein n=1 Tax=Cuscuta europaea TaxID=41803 RepID=A0A9P0Z118_CUSEU|nr:unnamed protein product [Cuscuta europaea]